MIRYAVTLLIAVLLFTTNYAHAIGGLPIFKIAAYSQKNNPLLKVAKKKGTVGIIPYYTIQGKTYIFLGQELPGGKREAAGTFSDFGGSIHPDGTTVLQHALREFKEETMGQMHLAAEDLLKNGYLLYKKTDKGREIYYIFLKLSDKQYQKTLKFHTATVRLKASSVPNSYLEKETFAWVSLDDIMQQVKIDPTAAAATTEAGPAAAIASTTPVAMDSAPSNANTVTSSQTSEQVTKSASTEQHTRMHATPENQRVVVHAPDGKSMNILLRGYFVHDCLQNPQFASLVQQLK